MVAEIDTTTQSRTQLNASHSALLIAMAAGAAAVGALAIGALIIGRLSIRRVSIDRADLKSLAIDDLTVTHLRAREVTVIESIQLPERS
jgi:hypothetical protein